jgi:hypothetical protein
MPPADPTPHGQENMHAQAEPGHPEPKPGEESDEPVRGQPKADSESRRDGGGTTTDDAAAGVDPLTGTGPDIAG